MICPNCGTNAEHGSAFCPNCGTTLGQTQTGQFTTQGQQQYQQPQYQQQQYQQPQQPQFQQQYQQPMQYNQMQNTDDKVGLIGILFFMFPLVGVIMFFVWKNTKPLKAGKAIKLALAGFIIGMAVSAIMN